MELLFRQRLDRLDRYGRAGITADVHWAGGHRLQLATGIKCLPANWQPGKTKLIHTREPQANQFNIDLSNYAARIGKVFSTAAAQDLPEAAVTPDQVRAAAATGPRAPLPPVPVPTPAELTLPALHHKWQQENAGLARHTLRRYQQVVNHLEVFQPGLRLSELTRKLVADYQVYLQQQGVGDSTFTNHVKFLREAFRTAGLHPPAYLKWRVPEARPVALTPEEFHQLVTHIFLPSQQHLAHERDVFVVQTLLLLRDSDLRRLRPGYVKHLPLVAGEPPTLVAAMPQQKTTEEVAVPFAPLAAGLWLAYGGKLPIVSQQNRNTRLKDMAATVGLTREVVKVRWLSGQMHETSLPLHQALTTHAARHTGADLLLSGTGDRNLVEIGLGHVNYVYGHDSIYRYGPQLLAAWRTVLGELATVGKAENCQRFAGDSVPEAAAGSTLTGTQRA